MVRILFLVLALAGCKMTHSIDDEKIEVEGKVTTEHNINLNLTPCQTDSCNSDKMGYDKKCVDDFLEIWRASLKKDCDATDTEKPAE